MFLRPALRDHFRNARHHLPAAEESAAHVHQFRNASAVANQFEHLRGDQRHALGIIEPKSARQPLLRQEAGVVQQELIDIAWRQVHELSPLSFPRVFAEERAEERESFARID